MIYEKIRDLVAKQFVVGPETLSRETSFTEDLNADSLDVVELTETEDILATLAAKKQERVVVGFAAETSNVVAYAQDKLGRKGCDAIVANDVSRADSGFGSDTDKAWWVTADGAEELPCMAKTDLAGEILSRAKALADVGRAR